MPHVLPIVRHLYLHFPVCAKICPYCAFYVHRGGMEVQRQLVQAMAWELNEGQKYIDLSQLETIYFGGGTPSLLTPELFTELASAIPKRTDRREFTLEANPATITPEKALAWKRAGIDRISLGAQSFLSRELELLGRQHRPDEISESCQLLREHGFRNINIDLIYGLPEQSARDWNENLDGALKCLPQHVSAYGLTYEEDTPFFEQLSKGLYKQDEAREIEMFRLTRERLHEAGLVDYEISNFARPGFESIHNRGYWQGHDYLGIGPSAVSTVGAWRWKNVASTEIYLKLTGSGDGEAAWLGLRTELEEMTQNIRMRERLMFGLRMREGVPEDTFIHQNAQHLSSLIESGLLHRVGDRIRLTLQGQLVADSVAAALL